MNKFLRWFAPLYAVTWVSSFVGARLAEHFDIYGWPATLIGVVIGLAAANAWAEMGIAMTRRCAIYRRAMRFMFFACLGFWLGVAFIVGSFVR